MIGVAELPQYCFPYRFANKKEVLYETGEPKIHNFIWQAQPGG